jgi:hypothetical protein
MDGQDDLKRVLQEGHAAGLTEEQLVELARRYTTSQPSTPPPAAATAGMPEMSRPTDAGPGFMDQVRQGIRNVPASFLRTIQKAPGILATQGAIANEITSAPARLAGRALFDEPSPPSVIAQLPGALREHVSDRYGSLERAGDTLRTDPVGAGLDAASVLSLGRAAKAPVGAALTRGGQALGAGAMRVMENPIAGALAGGTAGAAGTLPGVPAGWRGAVIGGIGGAGGASTFRSMMHGSGIGRALEGLRQVSRTAPTEATTLSPPANASGTAFTPGAIPPPRAGQPSAAPRSAAPTGAATVTREQIARELLAREPDWRTVDAVPVDAMARSITQKGGNIHIAGDSRVGLAERIAQALKDGQVQEAERLAQALRQRMHVAAKQTGARR